MTTFVGNHPETSGPETRPKTVQSPKSEPDDKVQAGMRKAHILRPNKAIQVIGSLVYDPNHERVPYAMTEHVLGQEKKKVASHIHVQR